MTEGLPKLVWTPEMVARFWDYESNFPDRYFTYRNGAEMVRQLRRHFRGKGTVLDYGCGPGFLLDELLAAGIEAAGLDFSPETMAKVDHRFGSRGNFLGTFTPDRLAESGRRFDAITVVEVIEHLYDEQLEELLSELGKFLEPGGVVIFTTPNEEKLEESSMLCPVSGEIFHRWQHVRNWSRESLTGYLQDRGYQVLECFATNFRGGPSKAKQRGAVGSLAASAKSVLARLLGKRKKTPHLVAIARPT